MTITESVVVPSGVEIQGSQAGVNASIGSRASMVDPADETIFSQPVILNGNARIDGVTLKAKPVIQDAKNVALENTRIVSIVAPGGSHLDDAVIAINQWNTSTKLVVDGCYFGDNTGIYNVFELNTPIANGSSINNNYFSAAVGSHNVINIYSVEDGAEVDIKDNHFEMSASAARIGIIGDKMAIFNFENNSYDATDMTDSDGDGVPEWAGLITIQPYGNQTISMKDIEINIDNTIISPSIPQQLFVYYSNTTDTQLDDANKPTVNVDGVKEDWTNLVHGRILP